MELGEKLLELRKKNGLSQEELAKELAVTRQTVSKWETGKTRPGASSIRKLSVIYKIEPEEILGEEVKIDRISAVEKADILGMNKELIIAALVVVLMLTAHYFIPPLGVLIAVGTFVKYRKRKYARLIYILAVVCLCLSVYFAYRYVSVYNTKNHIVIIEKLSE